MNLKQLSSALLLLLMLAGCSDEGAVWSPPLQQWQDMIIRIETRPSMPKPGMNEFLVIANRQQRGFSSDLIVNVRTEHSEWKQAIPDGALGVFRRALPVKNLADDHLYVRLARSNGDRGELTFALASALEQEAAGGK